MSETTEFNNNLIVGEDIVENPEVVNAHIETYNHELDYTSNDTIQPTYEPINDNTVMETSGVVSDEIVDYSLTRSDHMYEHNFCENNNEIALTDMHSQVPSDNINTHTEVESIDNHSADKYLEVTTTPEFYCHEQFSDVIKENTNITAITQSYTNDIVNEDIGRNEEMIALNEMYGPEVNDISPNMIPSSEPYNSHVEENMLREHEEQMAFAEFYNKERVIDINGSIIQTTDPYNDETVQEHIMMGEGESAMNELYGSKRIININGEIIQSNDPYVDQIVNQDMMTLNGERIPMTDSYCDEYVDENGNRQTMAIVGAYGDKIMYENMNDERSAMIGPYMDEGMGYVMNNGHPAAVGSYCEVPMNREITPEEAALLESYDEQEVNDIINGCENIALGDTYSDGRVDGVINEANNTVLNSNYNNDGTYEDINIEENAIIESFSDEIVGNIMKENIDQEVLTELCNYERENHLINEENAMIESYPVGAENDVMRGNEDATTTTKLYCDDAVRDIIREAGSIELICDERVHTMMKETGSIVLYSDDGPNNATENSEQLVADTHNNKVDESGNIDKKVLVELYNGERVSGNIRKAAEPEVAAEKYVEGEVLENKATEKEKQVTHINGICGSARVVKTKPAVGKKYKNIKTKKGKKAKVDSVHVDIDQVIKSEPYADEGVYDDTMLANGERIAMTELYSDGGIDMNSISENVEREVINEPYIDEGVYVDTLTANGEVIAMTDLYSDGRVDLDVMTPSIEGNVIPETYLANGVYDDAMAVNGEGITMTELYNVPTTGLELEGGVINEPYSGDRVYEDAMWVNREIVVTTDPPGDERVGEGEIGANGEKIEYTDLYIDEGVGVIIQKKDINGTATTEIYIGTERVEEIKNEEIKIEEIINANPVKRKEKKKKSKAKKRDPLVGELKPIKNTIDSSSNEKIDEQTRRNREKSVIGLIQNTYLLPFKTLSGFKCFYCDETYGDIEVLTAHTTINHVDPDKEQIKVAMGKRKRDYLIKMNAVNLACKHCDETILSFTDLKSHIVQKHGVDIDEKEDGVLPYKIVNGEFECVFCGIVYPGCNLLSNHMNDHYPYHTCPECGQGFITPQRLKSHKLVHMIRMHTCDICEKEYKSASAMYNHYRMAHKNEKLSKCPHCGQNFTSYYTRQRHILNVHGIKTDQFHCEICPAAFMMKNLLTRHMQSVHQKGKKSFVNRPFKCPHCEMRFIRVSYLNDHMVKHTGTRNFQCSVCFKSYGRKKTLTAHTRAVHWKQL